MSTHPDTLSLDELAQRIRELQRRIDSNALENALNAGDLLLEAQRRTPGGSWIKWLKTSCSIPVSTAALYMALARNRDKIEAAGATSLRAARKLIAGPRAAKFSEPKPKPTAILRKALSHVKAASANGISDAEARGNNNEAIASLRRLIALIAASGADINDIVVSISKPAKHHCQAA